MVLIPLEITKKWTEGSTIVEADWDNIRTPLLSFSVNTNNNFAQLGKDVFGSTYQWDNDGNPNRTTSLLDSLLFADQDYTLTGAWSFTTIPDLGTVITADINGGTIDGTVIGAGTPAAATFSSITVSATTRYASISGAAFLAATGSEDTDRSFSTAASTLTNVNGGFASRTFVAPVLLPNGAIVTELKSYFYRDDAASSLSCSLERYDTVGTNVQMALCTSNSTAGDHSITDSTITSGTINNSGYTYSLSLVIDNNNAATDAKFYWTRITYTVTQPLM
jgi:hypothetical protein